MHSYKSSYLVDPLEINARMSDDRAMEEMERFISGLLPEGVDETDTDVTRRLQEAIDTLPEREADFVDLYYFRHKTQTEIAYLFRVSQPTVCYRLQRATKRIRFLMSLPTMGMELLDDMSRDLRKILQDPDEDVVIMTSMYQTSCQSVVAQKLGVSQGKIRHRLMRSIRTLERHKDEPVYGKYYEIFTLLASQPNIRREVQRPSSSSKIRRILDCDPAPTSLSSFRVIQEEEDDTVVVAGRPKGTGEIPSWLWQAFWGCSSAFTFMPSSR